MSSTGGVFCIESWSARITNRETVRPLLEFIAQDGEVRFIHQRVETAIELQHYLSRFADLDSYGVAYVAMHGSSGKVWAGASSVALDDLATWARMDEGPTLSSAADFEWSTDLRGKVLYLGSCATLSRQSKRLRDLRELTGAAAVCGYTKSVDWYESAALEVMLLPALADATASAPNTVTKTLRRLRRRAGDLMDNLGFVAELPRGAVV